MQIQPTNRQPSYRTPTFCADIRWVNKMGAFSNSLDRAAYEYTINQFNWMKKWAAPIKTDDGLVHVLLGPLSCKEVKNPKAEELAPRGVDILIKTGQIVRASGKVDGRLSEFQIYHEGLKDTQPWTYFEDAEEKAARELKNRPKPTAAYQILGFPYLKIRELLKTFLESQGKYADIKELENLEAIEAQKALQAREQFRLPQSQREIERYREPARETTESTDKIAHTEEIQAIPETSRVVEGPGDLRVAGTVGNPSIAETPRVSLTDILHKAFLKSGVKY